MINKTAVLLLLMSVLSIQKAYAQSIDETIENFLSPFSDKFSQIVFSSINIFGSEIPLLILVIILTGIFCTIYFRGLSIWGFSHALKKIFEKKEHNGKIHGEISTLGALASALSGCIGIGNIAGVAIAVSVGGPGAVFWMCIGAFFGMTIKFCEVTLALKYRRIHSGVVSGGPMYYIEKGFARRKNHALGKTLSYIFALSVIPGTIGGSCLLQTNQAAQQFINITGGENSFFAHHAWVFGLAVSILIGLVIVGGIKSIANVTTKLVPAMCLIYLCSCLIIIAVNIDKLPAAVYTIIHDAFIPQAVYGGFTGALIIGLRRSLQSNEAGIGSSPIAYAAVKTDEPVSQGFVSMIEPFFDTVIVCSMTALVIVITGEYTNYTSGISGVELTSAAFKSVFPFFPYILAVVIILFAVSTILSWSYYGQKAWAFLAGEGKKRSMFFNIMLCVFILAGSCMNIKSIIDFTDASYMIMAAANLTALCVLLKDVKKELIKYCRKNNLINPVNKSWFNEEIS